MKFLSIRNNKRDNKEIKPFKLSKKDKDAWRNNYGIMATSTMKKVKKEKKIMNKEDPHVEVGEEAGEI